MIHLPSSPPDALQYTFLAVALLCVLGIVFELYRWHALKTRHERIERRCSVKLHKVCPAHPQILGVYFFPLSCEGGAIDGGVCIQFKPGTSLEERQWLTQMIRNELTRLKKDIALLTSTDKEHIEEELSTMRLDIYVQCQRL